MAHNCKYNLASIDTETTGLGEQCQVLEIGIVLDNSAVSVFPSVLDEYLESLPTFHCYIKHDLIVGEPYALNLNSGILEILAKGESQEILRPWQVAEALQEFFLEHDCPKLTPAGKNLQSFDIPFLNRISGAVKDTLNSMLHRRTVDPALLYFNPHQDQRLPSLQECLDRAGIDKRVSHTAIDDARDVLKLLKLKWSNCRT